MYFGWFFLYHECCFCICNVLRVVPLPLMLCVVVCVGWCGVWDVRHMLSLLCMFVVSCVLFLCVGCMCDVCWLCVLMWFACYVC